MSSDTRTTYLALAALAKRYAAHSEEPGPRPHGDLTAHELRVFSQNGEDGVIEEILHRIGTGSRHFVEFGVESGIEGNCVFLADVLGWSGLFMEADPDRFAFLEGKYRHQPQVRTVQALVHPSNINELLRDAGVPEEPDVLSIDVDGIDLWIWAAIGSRVRARIVVIEYNSSLDPAAALTQPLEPPMPWDGTSYFGASLGALRRVAAARGYRLVHTDVAGVNAFFVRSDLAAPFPDEGAVPTRAPNYFLRGAGHPPHEGTRRYIDPVI
jgi:hypothetical protein